MGFNLHTPQDIPEVEPLDITAGSTVKWKKTLSHYKASDGWTLTYAIRGATILDITASADGADHSVTLSATQTGALKSGTYWWNAYASKGVERFDVGTGTFTVKANLASLLGGAYDGRSHVKKVLDAIEATLEGRASTLDKETEINGVRVEFYSATELLLLYDRYKAMYSKEVNAERIARGNKSRGIIYTRFIRA